MRWDENAVPVKEILAWREGDWIRVSLDGQIVWQRLTRDKSFKKVHVLFASHQSPSLPKAKENFERCELVGGKVASLPHKVWGNSVVVDITESREAAENPPVRKHDIDNTFPF